MGIDYGTKRTGIAVTDELQIIAHGLTTVPSNEIINFLKKYFEKENVECIVVGEAKHLDGKKSETEKYTEQFILSLMKNFPSMQIERMDERFTSKMAFQTMIDSGLKKKDRQNKSLLDEISATIILQSYLQKKNLM